MNCPLCSSSECFSFCRDKRREFFRCPNCELVFVPEIYHLSKVQERERYAYHDNRASNGGYTRFLSDIVHTIKSFSNGTELILDFGAGENAVLTELLKKEGYNCSAYDPLYSSEIKNGSFDIVILCEVIEHVRSLQDEILLLNEYTNNRGYIVLRTQILTESIDFLKWWYKEDLTHILFFSSRSIAVLAQKLFSELIPTRYDDIYVLKRMRGGNY